MDKDGLSEFSEAVNLYNEASKKLKPFHFADERHEHRIGFVTVMSGSPLTTITVLSHKPTLAGSGGLDGKRHYLFYYTAKLLLERITWFIDQQCGSQSSEKVSIVFSDRGQLKRTDLDNYLDRLKNQTELEAWLGATIGNHDIHWNRIDEIGIAKHNSLLGLQAADASASSMRAAVEPSPHMLTEHRYLKILSPKVWSRKGKVASYGIKFMPAKVKANPYVKHDRFHWLSRLGCPRPE